MYSKKPLKLGLYEMEFFSHQILCRVLLQENNSKSLQMYVWSSNEIMSATIFLDLPHIAKGILWLLQIVRKICCMYNEKGEKKSWEWSWTLLLCYYFSIVFPSLHPLKAFDINLHLIESKFRCCLLVSVWYCCCRDGSNFVYN